MKVSEIIYERYKIEDLSKAFNDFQSTASNEVDLETFLKARELFLNEMIKFSTASSLAHCRFTLNTKDKFYIDEVAYYDNVSPLASEISVKYGELMLETPLRNQIEKHVNPICYRKYENARKAYSPSIEKECQTENAITTEYSKFMSELAVDWNGEKLPLSFVRGFLDAPDRNVRKAAALAIGSTLGENSQTLDDIFDRLVKIRHKMALKMGYENFIELGYYRMERIDYNKEMVEKFRENVYNDLVPVVCKIKEGLAAEFNIDKIKFYDEGVYIKGGNPRPKNGADGIFKNAQLMYDEMDNYAGNFMRSMIANEAFDVEARDGKWGGGYCTGFDSYKQPFILANFNGSADDIGVITHEFGHALAANLAYDQDNFELQVGSMETAECHSMSMEFFCDKYMDKFFDKPNDYKKTHLLSSICFIPYGVIVDEFQHIVYKNPEMTPNERNNAYKQLEEKYRPYLDFSDIPYINKGTRWQYQMHIYESPFYYIDYCLAQTVSLCFLVMMEEDYEKAWEKYFNFVKTGGLKLFSQLIADAGIPSPFEPGQLKKLTDKLDEIIKN